MTIKLPSSEENLPPQAETACGARIKVSSDTPLVRYRDEIVYFCGWDCKQLYDDDPLNSCMAARLLSGN
ncbi:MAG: hypothetical protein A2Z71_11770 [Chloroflexi bacterium RBG_13_50_21]|nr:MAG: hypothetical protein A2Z71_11770 [Chloroflexi bacterium RBG_13_50_21]